MNSTGLDNLRELTDSIKEGKRVILFPPGMTAFIAFIILMIPASVLFFSPVINIFLTGAPVSVMASLQPGSLLIYVVAVVFPALAVLSGKKHFTIISFYYALALTALSAIILLLGFAQVISLSDSTTPLLACIALSVTCILIYNSASYLLLKEFYYLLKNPEAN